MVMVFDRDTLTLIVLGLLLVLTGGALLMRRRAGRSDPYPFTAAPWLDAPLKALLPRLDEVLEGRYLVCPLLPLEQLVRSRAGLSGKSRRQQEARLAAHRVDVLLCDKATLEPVGALLIERPEDRAGFRAHALLAAGLPTVLLKQSALADADQLRDQIAEGLAVRLGGPQGPANKEWVLGVVEAIDDPEGGWTLGGFESAGQRTTTPERAVPAEGWPPCPDCGAPQQVRRAARGRHQGRAFLVCSRFPQCQQLRPLEKT